MFQVCKDVYPSDKDNNYCVTTNVQKLDKDKQKTDPLELNIPYNESCFYQVESACGWPTIKVDTSEVPETAPKEGYFDVAVALVDMTPINGEPPANINFPSPSYPFKSNETITRNARKRGETEIKFAGVVDDSVTQCQNQFRRVMIVTISNFNKAPKDIVPNGQSAHEARSLQASKVKTLPVKVTFSYAEGTGKGAIKLMMRTFFALATFFMIMQF